MLQIPGLLASVKVYNDIFLQFQHSTNTTTSSQSPESESEAGCPTPLAETPPSYYDEQIKSEESSEQEQVALHHQSPHTLQQQLNFVGGLQANSPRPPFPPFGRTIGDLYGEVAAAGSLEDSTIAPPAPDYTSGQYHHGFTLATYDSYSYSHRMAGMTAYPSGPVGPTSGSVPTSKSSMPYAVNGISLTGPSVDLVHPAMNYQGKKRTFSVSSLRHNVIA